MLITDLLATLPPPPSPCGTMPEVPRSPSQARRTRLSFGIVFQYYEQV